MKNRVDERIDEGVLRWREWRMIGLLRESMQESVLVVAQWVGRVRDRLIP